MSSNARNKRRFLKWERYYLRTTRHRGVIWGAHAMAYYRVACIGRWAPNGIRDPWMWPISWARAKGWVR